MPTEARRCKGTEYEFVSRELEVFRDSFCIAETNELFDSAGVTTEGRLSPATADCHVYGVFGTVGKHKGVVANAEERVVGKG